MTRSAAFWDTIRNGHRVTVNGRHGTFVTQTRRYRMAGADIQFDGEPYTRFIELDRIEIVDPDGAA